MSQAKVDKRKYEKVHRKEIEKKRKIKTAVICIVVALAVGTCRNQHLQKYTKVCR